MHEPVDVLDMVVSLVGSFDFLLGLTGVDTLENAQAPAIVSYAMSSEA